MNVEALQTKYPIIDWEVYTEDSRMYWKIMRVDENDTPMEMFKDMHDPLKWRLYDTCGVHHMCIERGHDIFILVEKDYPLTRALMTLMLCNKLQVDEYSVMADELLRKIFILANKSRQGGLLGIKGFYKFLLLVQLSTAKRRLNTQLRGYSFDEIKTLFETTIRKVNTFGPIESEVDRAVPELAAGSSKRDAEEELDQESSKRQMTDESSELAEEPRVKEADELSQEELQQMMIIVLEQGMNVEALQTKYPIIDWEIYTEGTKKYWKIIKVGNYTEVHQFFDDMLKAFDRDDLVMLWSLVKEKFNSTEPTDDKEREIWVELKRLFEPDTDDELWKLC
ncbi:hypothetical protein Tco_1490581 [Tanacetum coccineum]